MIRRIMVILALLFVSFFVWHWLDKDSAQHFLTRIRTFSFNTPEQTTQLIDQSTTDLPANEPIVGEPEPTPPEYQADPLLDQILTPTTLEANKQVQTGVAVQVEWLPNSGIVVVEYTGVSELPHPDSLPKTSSSSIDIKMPTELSEQDYQDMKNLLQAIE